MLSETSACCTSADSDVGLSLILTIVDDFVIVTRDRAVMVEIKRRLRTAWTIVDKAPAECVN